MKNLLQRVRRGMNTGLVALVVACGPAEMNTPSVDNGSKPSDNDAADVYTPEPDAGFYNDAQTPDAGVGYADAMAKPDAMRPLDGSVTYADARTNQDAMGMDVGRINQAPIVYAGSSMELELDVDYCFNFARNPTTMRPSCRGSNTRWAPGHSPAGTGSYDPDGTIVWYTVRLDKNNPMAPTSRDATGVFSFGFWRPGEYIFEVGAEDNEGARTYSETTVNVR